MPFTDSYDSQKMPVPLFAWGQARWSCVPGGEAERGGQGRGSSQAPCDQGGMASTPHAPPVCWGGMRGSGREELLQPTLGAGQGLSRGRKGLRGGRGMALGSGSEDAAVQTRMQWLGWGELGSQALEVVPAVYPRDTHPRVPGWGGRAAGVGW